MINCPDLVSAWQAGVQELLVPGRPEQIMALRAGPGWNHILANERVLDRAAEAVGAERPTSVANMLMPNNVISCDGTAAEAIQLGLAYFGRGRRRGLHYSGWTNTYFERLAGAWIDRVGQTHVIKENRLLNIIRKLQTWPTNPAAALYAHTDSPSDSLRTRGGPCLQYVQFRAHGAGELEIIAVYRAHDYFHKTLGNMVGLSRLGRFVAEHTNRTLSGITVVSLHPFFQATKSEIDRYANLL